ncbi:MAG: hypothetical protein AAFO95_10270 [Cyanobacteria bacterium J06600_6]
MIELLYLASQIQCGANGDFLNIQVDVYQGAELIETMMVDDRALISVDSVDELDFQYSVVGDATNCISLAIPSELSLDTDSSLPEMNGFANQSSVQTLLNGLNDYEELFLAELGTDDSSSAAFDMQDVVLRIDNNPTISSVFAD